MTAKGEQDNNAFLIWITGLSGSGKSTIAKAVYEDLKNRYPNTVLLDGDDFRDVIGKRDAYSAKDRLQIALQISNFCKLLVNQGINVVCATISLFKEAQQANRQNVDKYYEIMVHCEMDELIRRDKKEIYSKALKGEMKNVVGVNMEFDKPENCDLTVNNTNQDALQDNILEILKLTTE